MTKTLCDNRSEEISQRDAQQAGALPGGTGHRPTHLNQTLPGYHTTIHAQALRDANDPTRSPFTMFMYDMVL